MEFCGFVWNVLKMVKTRQISNTQEGRGGLDLGGQQLLPSRLVRVATAREAAGAAVIVRRVAHVLRCYSPK